MPSKPPAENKHLEGLVDAPVIFVDGYQGVSISAGVAKINFYTLAFDPGTEKTKKVAAFQLATALPTLVKIHDALGKLFESLEKQGVIQQVKAKTKSGENV